MNPWEPNNLNLHDNYNPNLNSDSYCAYDITQLHPSEELYYRHGGFLRNFMIPPASGSLESLVAQGTFLCTTNQYELPLTSVVYASPPAANMTSTSHMKGIKSFTEDKSSVPSLPAPASQLLHVKPNITGVPACYQGEASAQKGRKGKNKSKEPACLHRAQERTRRERINRSLGALRTTSMSGINANKDTASMLEEVTNYVKLLETQLKMANIMNIAPKDVTRAMHHHLQMSTLNPSSKSGDAAVVTDSDMKSTGVIGISSGNSFNIISSSPDINKMSVVHPTIYVPQTFFSGKQDPVFDAQISTQIMDPISAYVELEKICSTQVMDPISATESELRSAQVMDPISAYVTTLKSELPSMDEFAKMIATFEQFQQNIP